MNPSKNIQLDWLKGKCILLVAHYVPGPTAAYLLRVMGARVIKVEPPYGDLIRQFPPFLEGKNGNRQSAYFRALNAGFESIVVNFRHSDGVEVLRDLIAEADVLIDGNRPGYLTRILGQKPQEIHPNLIEVALAAQGQHGPESHMTGHDNNALARAGAFQFANRLPSGNPGVSGPQIADMMAGFSAAITILGALFAQQNPENRTTIPPIDASLLHSAFFLNQIHLPGNPASMKAPEWMNGSLPNYSMYQTKDGKAVFLGPLEPNLFQNFCQAMQRPDWMLKLQENPGELKTELEKVFLAHDLPWWEAKLKTVDCCFSKVNDLSEALTDPQLMALGLADPVHDPNFGLLHLTHFPTGFGSPSLPPAVPFTAPELGEHTESILGEMKTYSLEKIQALKANGAIK